MSHPGNYEIIPTENDKVLLERLPLIVPGVQAAFRDAFDFAREHGQDDSYVEPISDGRKEDFFKIPLKDGMVLSGSSYEDPGCPKFSSMALFTPTSREGKYHAFELTVGKPESETYPASCYAMGIDRREVPAHSVQDLRIFRPDFIRWFHFPTRMSAAFSADRMEGCAIDRSPAGEILDKWSDNLTPKERALSESHGLAGVIGYQINEVLFTTMGLASAVGLMAGTPHFGSIES